MEYCAGGSVQDVMNMMADEKQGGLSELDIAYILKSVLAGLQYLHSHKIIHKYVIAPKNLTEPSYTKYEFIQHRDLKAANILLNSEGKAKLGKRFVLEFQCGERTYPNSLYSADFGTAGYLRTMSCTGNHLRGTRALHFAFFLFKRC